MQHRNHAAPRTLAVVLAAALTLMSAAAFAEDAPAPVTVTGKATGVNYARQGFWINTNDNRNVPTLAEAATFHYMDQDANFYRLTGDPQVEVTGTMDGPIFHATNVKITSGPTVKLQESSYTAQAKPPFAPGELVPTHHAANIGGATTDTAVTGSGAANITGATTTTNTAITDLGTRVTTRHPMKPKIKRSH